MKVRKGINMIFSVLLICALLLQAVPVFADEVSTFSVTPATQTVEPGDSFSVDILIDAKDETRGAEIKLEWDPNLVEVLSVAEGTFYSGFGNTFMVAPTINNVDGTFDVNAAIAVVGGTGGPSGEGALFTINLEAKEGAAGTSSLTIAEALLSDPDADPLPVTVVNGAVVVEQGTPPADITVDIRATGMEGDVFNAPGFTVPAGTVTVGLHELDKHTAMGALAYYCQVNSIAIDIQQGTWGLYVNQIGSDTADENSWMYYVNGSSPWTGADQYNLTGGEELHYVNFLLGYYSLTLTLDKSQIDLNEDVTVTVTYTDGEGISSPVEGAKVFISDSTDQFGNPAQPGFSMDDWLTDSDGEFTGPGTVEGTFYPYAEWDGKTTAYQWPVASFTVGDGSGPGGPDPDPGVDGDTIIQGNIAGSLILNAPSNIMDWALAVGDNSETGTLNVKSNQPWQAQVEDANKTNEGHMSRWAGGGFDWSSSLDNPLFVNQGSTSIDLTNGGIIASGIVADQPKNNSGQDFDLEFKQEVLFADPVLESGAFYRIMLKFTGEPLI